MGQQLRRSEELYHIFCSSPFSCKCPISKHVSSIPCSGPILISFCFGCADNYSHSYNLHLCSTFVSPEAAGGNRLPTGAAQGRRQRGCILHVHLCHLAGGGVDVVSYAGE